MDTDTKKSGALTKSKLRTWDETLFNLEIDDLCQINHGFPLSLGQLGKLRGAAPRVCDIGHDIIGLTQHPLVSIAYGEATGDSLSTIRRLKANESVSTNTLDALCAILECAPDDINEYLPDKV